MLCLLCSTPTESGQLLRWKADPKKQRGELSRVYPLCAEHKATASDWLAMHFGELRDLVNDNETIRREFEDWLGWVAVRSIVSFEGYLYLFRSEELFKVGFTNRVEKRLRYMQVNNPAGVVLVSAWLGNRDHEVALHKRLAAQHVRGEWYRLDGMTLAAQIEQLRTSTCR